MTAPDGKAATAPRPAGAARRPEPDPASGRPAGAETGGASGAEPPAPSPRPPQCPRHRATDLTGGGSQAQIVLGNQVYLLRITRAGKLILTK